MQIGKKIHVVKCEIVIIFSSISLNIRFEVAKQPSHGHGFFCVPTALLSVENLAFVLGSHKKRLYMTVFLNTHDICFG